MSLAIMLKTDWTGKSEAGRSDVKQTFEIIQVKDDGTLNQGSGKKVERSCKILGIY